MAWVFLAVLTFVASMSSTVASASGAPVWQFEGRFGPDYWGTLNSNYGTCDSGKAQSPIDITDAYDTSLFEPRIDWAQDGWEIANTNNMIVLRNGSAGTTGLGPVQFTLQEVHFRHPAEHLVDGIRFEMEVQFHHKRDDQSLVLSVFLQGEGRFDMLEQIVGRAPIEPGKKPKDLAAIDLITMMPDLGDAWVYRGSLTTPPCTEGVTWMVFQDPVSVSNAAILAFDALQLPNARPVQPTYGRFVLTD